MTVIVYLSTSIPVKGLQDLHTKKIAENTRSCADAEGPRDALQKRNIALEKLVVGE